MKNTPFLSGVCLIFAIVNSNVQAQKIVTPMTQPKAKIIPKTLEKHNQKRIDNYFWLNDRENPEVIDYLNQENAYYEASTAGTKDFQKALYEEMKARIKEDDQSVPYLYNGYYYITRYETGKDYPIYSRKKGSLSAAEEILFDCNELAKGHSYFQLGGMSISPDNKLVSFGIDTVGRRIYTIQIKNLETGELFSDTIENADGSSVWANDNKTIFYTRQDTVTLRSDKVFKHKVGTSADQDVVVFYEKDDTFSVSVGKEKSKKYIVISSGSTLTTEYRILNAEQPDGEFAIFQKRVRGLEYSISHFGDSFYILTNKDKASNFKLMKTPENATSKENWKDVIAHREDVLLEDIEIFKNYLVVEERSNGLNHIRIMPWSGEADYYLPFGSETYNALLRRISILILMFCVTVTSHWLRLRQSLILT